MRVGILGGTFDPIHNGHLAAARLCAAELRLDRVLLVPARAPQHRTSEPVATPDQRLAMVCAACSESHASGIALEPCGVDIDRAGPTFTIDTIADIRRMLPEAELFLILGDDAYRGFSSWREPDRVRSLVTIVVVQRRGLSAQNPSLPAQPETTQQQNHHNVIRVDLSGYDISATAIRARAAAGLSLAGLVPASVERYITEHRLYR